MKNETKPQAKHTPGPWMVEKWNGARGETFVQVQGPFEKSEAFDAMSGRPIGQDRRCIARCGTTREDVVEANASLIAAAPELLAALRGLVCELDSVKVPAPGLVHARAAIAKATGEVA